MESLWNAAPKFLFRKPIKDKYLNIYNTHGHLTDTMLPTFRAYVVSSNTTTVKKIPNKTFPYYLIRSIIHAYICLILACKKCIVFIITRIIRTKKRKYINSKKGKRTYIN